ncbi:MAG TPA: multicopper oxidase family protein [Rhizomicrobium sp.]|nr:multicopper oxidase family protein [Rhizomicrobium sp.]
MSTRRDFLLSGTALGASLAGCALFSEKPRGRLAETRLGSQSLQLIAQQRAIALGKSTNLPAWLYQDRPFPVLRLKQGEALNVTLVNRLAEHTSIHWHGIRVPNAMDGVPYLTQLPVQPGETFRYRFTPPDAGTYFFHPHCNTVEQMGRGLLGALIVEDPRDAYDDDIVLILKDWRVGDDGAFLPFLTAKGASQAGTFGTLRTVNGVVAPRIATHAQANIRLRLINADPTRIAQIGIDGAPATVIAIDGNPVVPFALETWRLGPGMRLDLSLRTARAGIRLLDFFSAAPILLASLDPDNSPSSNRDASLAQSSQPDFSGATRLSLELGAGVDANAIPSPQPIILPDGRTIDLADSLCLAQGTFWTLNGKSWPDRDHSKLPPPLFTFRRSEKVVLDIANTTSRTHPIHIHGHTMSVLSTSLLARPVHRADTVLVLPNERVRVGFVADNPGNWMIHCHVLEHQETGMMGWFRVS